MEIEEPRRLLLWRNRVVVVKAPDARLVGAKPIRDPPPISQYSLRSQRASGTTMQLGNRRGLVQWTCQDSCSGVVDRTPGRAHEAGSALRAPRRWPGAYFRRQYSRV